MLNIAAACLVITALLAYLNHRVLKIPTTIGVMAAALVFSLALVGLNALSVAQSLHDYETSLLRSINFSDILMQGILSLPLFAGALHIDLSGGISVALSLTTGPERDTVLAITYCVVAFSVLAQGLSIGYVTKKSLGSGEK